MTELLVTMFAASIVLSGILAMVQMTTTQTVRVSERVQANQRAKPVLQRLMDELHSSCVAPDVIPVQAGSIGTQLIFWSQTGDEVNPTPNQHVVTVSGGNVTESIYPATGGTPPLWTFSGTPSSTRTLLTNVSNATVDGGTVAPFRYYRYAGNQISPTPIPTPLDATTAQQAVLVNVSFAVGSTENGTRDTKNAVTVSDQAVLRLSSASSNGSVVNDPCA